LQDSTDGEVSGAADASESEDRSICVNWFLGQVYCLVSGKA
jgi:hypothetical protein